MRPTATPTRYLPAMRRIAAVDGPAVPARARVLHPPLTWGRDDLGHRVADRRANLLEPARGGARTGARPGEELTSRHNDVAAAVQARLEELILHLAGSLAASTGSPNLCLAGGVALNAVANGRIRPETPFEELYVQPAAGDSGTAVGAAFHVWHEILGAPRGHVMRHAYTGPALRRRGTRGGAGGRRGRGRAARRRHALPRSSPSESPPATSSAGSRAGWSSGPRALGNRSILADPRRADMKDVLNARVKHREPFRPFAPSVLAERDRGLVRPELPLAVHGARLLGAPREARPRACDHPRRRHGQAADGRGGGEPALPPPDRRVRAADGRPDPAQHVVQRERADRDEPRATRSRRSRRRGSTCSCSGTTSCGAATRRTRSAATRSRLSENRERGHRAKATSRARSALSQRGARSPGTLSAPSIDVGLRRRCRACPRTRYVRPRLPRRQPHARTALAQDLPTLRPE